MYLSAARRGWSVGVVLASCSSFGLLGCGSLLGYESDYDDQRGAGVAGSASGASVAGAAGNGGGSVGGRGGQGGTVAGQGGTASGASGVGGAGQGGTNAGQSGASASSGTAGVGAAAGDGGAGQGGANAGQSGGGQAGTNGGAAGTVGGGGQAGSLSGGNAGAGQGGSGQAGAGAAGVAGASGSAGAGGAGAAGVAGASGSAGAGGGSGGAGGLPACVIPTAPSVLCVDVLTSRDNCGACGLSCGAQGECVGGRCVLDPLAKAPYARDTGYFALPLATQVTPGSDRLLYRVQVSDPTAGAVHALYDISTSDDAPLQRRLGTNAIKVGGVDRPVTGWKSARFVGNTNQVMGVAAVARIPDEYPQDRVLVSLDRTTGNVLSTFQLAGDGGSWTDTRPPSGGLRGALETQDTVALGTKRGVVWDFIEGPTGGAVLRGFPVPLAGTGVFDTVIEPRYALAGPLVAQSDVAYFLSQSAANAPFRLKAIKLEIGALEENFGAATQTFVHPTAMAVVPNALFVADVEGDPAQPVSPKGTLYRYDLAPNCTKSSPQPVKVVANTQRLVALAADATYVYTLEVRDAAGGNYENVLKRRFHDGTGEVTLLVEARPGSFLMDDDRAERAERLTKGFVLGQSFGKPMVFFGMGSDPAEYREPDEHILGMPR